jgi:hypothetical protein
MKGLVIRFIWLIAMEIFSCFSYAGTGFSALTTEGKRLFTVDLDSMQAKLGKEKKFSAELIVTNKNVAGFMHSITATIHRKGDCMYYKLMQLEYLFAEKHSVIVNHKARSIAYVGKDEKGSSIKPAMPELDSVLMLYDSVVCQGEINGTRKYVIYNHNGLISKCEAYFNPSVMFFTKLVYKYNRDILGEEATIEVDYKDIQYAPVFSDNEFSENRFIVKKGKAWVPVPALQGYSITEGKTDFGEY